MQPETIFEEGVEEKVYVFGGGVIKEHKVEITSYEIEQKALDPKLVIPAGIFVDHWGYFCS